MASKFKLTPAAVRNAWIRIFFRPRRIARPAEARCLPYRHWKLVRAYLTRSTLRNHIACESGDPWDYYLDRGCGRAGEPSVAAPRSRVVSESRSASAAVVASHRAVPAVGPVIS